MSFEKWSEDHSNRTFNFTKGRGNNTAVPKAPRREIKKQQLHKGNRGEGEGREGGEGRDSWAKIHPRKIKQDTTILYTKTHKPRKRQTGLTRVFRLTCYNCELIKAVVKVRNHALTMYIYP